MSRIRPVTIADLPAILGMLIHEDEVRDSEPTERHRRALAEIEADPRNEVLVVEDAGEVVGCLQLTFIPGLSRTGADRANIEAVRIRADRRGTGLGRALMEEAIRRARVRGCGLVQLTSRHRRVDAHRFYESLGFSQSHLGYKLDLD